MKNAIILSVLILIALLGFCAYDNERIRVSYIEEFRKEREEIINQKINGTYKAPLKIAKKEKKQEKKETVNIPLGNVKKVKKSAVQIEEVRRTVEVKELSFNKDFDGDGISDNKELVIGARKDAKNKTKYRDGQYKGGYPPENIGVCTDTIWKAFKEAGYNLKGMIDEDIKNNLSDYPRVGGKPDPDIDFRRVKNLKVFLGKYSKSLTTKIIPGDIENLKEWQAGDIVIFEGERKNHIAIISDKRNKDGVPYIIHNSWPHAREEDALIYRSAKVYPITYHYRFEG